MNKQDAKVICRILRTADGGCKSCVSDLLEWFGIKYPEHQRVAAEAWLDHCDCDVTEENLVNSGLDFSLPYRSPEESEDYEIESSGYKEFLEIMALATDTATDTPL